MSLPRDSFDVHFPLADVLSLPALRTGAPEVLVGDAATCLVRWVHSSEVFEMGPLLKGGELLLTTGLGLRGAGDALLESYVDLLADAGVAALAIELGRTFAVLPPVIAGAARRRGMTLLVFHDVVPFETVIEAFHELLMDHQISALRLGDRIWKELLGVVLDGKGLQAFTTATAGLAGCPAYLLARDGRLVAGSERVSGVGDDASPERATTSAVVTVRGNPWGSLVLQGPRSATTEAVLERASTIVGLELARSVDPRDRPAHATALIRDIVDNRLPSVDELRARCEVAGFPAQPGRPFVGLAVAGDRRAPRQGIVEGVERAAREAFGTCLVGELDDDVIAIARAPRGSEAELRTRLDQLTAQLSASVERSSDYSVVAVGAGVPVDDFAELARSISQAREVVGIARRIGTRRAALLARDLGVYRLLARLQGGPELSAFLREQLGPLLDHDTAHGTELVRTLDAYLACAQVKTETARALGVRRQTLYNRLARIEKVLGGVALSDHERRNALSLALYAWRLRTGLDPSRDVV